MTIFRNKSKKKRTSIQLKVIHSIALAGHLSRRKVEKQIESHYANVYDAFTVLIADHIIEFSYSYKSFKSRRGEIYYKLTGQGLNEFIDQGISPGEFWIAIAWFCKLGKRHITKDEFERYYSLFAQKYTGSSSFHGCFFQTEFFDQIFKKWEENIKGENEEFPQDVFDRHPSEKKDDTSISEKVLMCLALNRSITVDDIAKIAKVPKERVSEVLKNYTLTAQEQAYYLESYKTVPWTSELERIIPGHFYHQIVVSKYKNGDILYELSFIGILLVLRLIGTRQRDFSHFYEAIASNYTEKLPLIFGKWNLLKTSGLDFSSFPSIFNYIFLAKSEVLSLSVLLGGNKEIYDNTKSVMFERIYKFSQIYDKAEAALPDWYLEKLKQNKNLKLIQDKINEIETLLKYTDLKSFGEYMKKPEVTNTVDGTSYEEELHVIENGLAEEFTMLFYIALMRENNHVASDYPLTIGFINSHPNLLYPKDILMTILSEDIEIRNKIKKWITEAIDYQKSALDKMNEMLKEMSWYK